jgi:predicted flap endonuclease-1-like 5' DNA nuclease
VGLGAGAALTADGPELPLLQEKLRSIRHTDAARKALRKSHSSAMLSPSQVVQLQGNVKAISASCHSSLSQGRATRREFMSYKIQEIEGIGPSFAAKLEKANIATTDDLLELCCDARGRKTVSEQTGISARNLLKWTNMADLMRVSGVGQEYSELLEAAGVDTIKELATRKPENLAAKMEKVNAAKKLARATPTAKAVAGWVEQAKSLDPIISH